MADEPTSPGKTEPMRWPVVTLMAGAFALAAGSAIAWVDTRPNWDDTGVTVGALLLAAGLAAVLGLRWWVAALLVGCPIVLLEHRSAGWGILVALTFTTTCSAPRCR